MGSSSIVVNILDTDNINIFKSTVDNILTYVDDFLDSCQEKYKKVILDEYAFTDYDDLLILLFNIFICFWIITNMSLDIKHFYTTKSKLKMAKNVNMMQVESQSPSMQYMVVDDFKYNNL